MSDVFSLRRFGWLIRKIIQERTTQMLGTILLCFTVTFIVYAMTRLLQGIQVAQYWAFVVGLPLGGSLMASVVFGYFSNNAMGVSFLTLPASLLEKWLSGILFVGVFYFPLFLAFFRLLDLAFVSQFHHSLDHHAPFYKEQYEMVYLLSFTESTAWGNYLMFFNFTGIMMLGTLFFNKAAFVKTALVICTVIVGAFLLNLLVVSQLIKNMQTAFPFSVVWIWVGKDRAAIELSPETADKIKFIFRFVLPAILWSLSLLRLKEKEF